MNIDKLQKYFDNKIIKYKEIKGHFNKNFEVGTNDGKYHLKIFKNQKHKIKKGINGKAIIKGDEITIMLICEKLKKYHNLNFEGQEMDYKDNQIKNHKYNDLLTKYKDDKWVACHNDLNKDNIIINNQEVSFIDFEFKRINNKYGDIANIINEDNLTNEHIDGFLKYYDRLEKAKLKDFIYINKIFNKFGEKERQKKMKQK